MEEGRRFSILSASCMDTVRIGEVLGKSLKGGEILAIRGELGAGKTVLVKGIAKGLGVEEEPNSPTFVIMNAYEGRIPLYHFDLYRVSGIGELEDIGYEEYFFGDGVTVVEWADRIPEVFPKEAIQIEIEILGENEREIKFKGDEEWLFLFKSTVERALPTLTKLSR